MRFFCFLLLSSLVLFALPLTAQNSDSLSRVVDSTGKAIREASEDFQRWKDSVQRDRIFRNVERNGKSLDVLLQEMKEEQKSNQRRMWFRIGLGALFLVVVVVGLLQRRKKRHGD